MRFAAAAILIAALVIAVAARRAGEPRLHVASGAKYHHQQSITNCSKDTGHKMYYVLATSKCHSYSNWTLHGLWPQCTSSSWPSYCSAPKFDPSEISKSLLEQMDIYWPSCYGGSDSFWEHEWEKHGSCSGLTQNKYIELAICVLKNTNPSDHGCSGEDCKISLPNGLPYACQNMQ